MKELFSIRARETTYRVIIVAIIVVSAIVVVLTSYFANKTVQESKKVIFIRENDNALVKAYATDLTNSYDILARGAVERINQLIYQQVPDVDNMNKQLREALVMSDKNTKTLIDILKNQDYFNNIISQNFYTLLLTDSINIDYSSDPHVFIYKGTLKIVRDKLTANRSIVTTGEIQQVGMVTSGNNSGFLIKKMKLISDTNE